jgi:hypothetical protein
MNGAPEWLPLLREVNHRISIMDENKRYKYHSPRCPDSLKPELIKTLHDTHVQDCNGVQ